MTDPSLNIYTLRVKVHGAKNSLCGDSLSAGQLLVLADHLASAPDGAVRCVGRSIKLAVTSAVEDNIEDLKLRAEELRQRCDLIRVDIGRAEHLLKDMD